MAKVITLPNGDQVVDRRQNVILTGPVLTLILFLLSQAIGGIWWASWVTAKLEFMTIQMAELKQELKQGGSHGTSKLVVQRSAE